MGKRRLALSSVSVTSAAFIPRRVGEPLKITSAISLPRRLLMLCSPRTHLMPSTTFDFPDPLGPTTTVIPGGNSNRVLSAKLLKPASSSALSITKRGVRSGKETIYSTKERHRKRNTNLRLISTDFSNPGDSPRISCVGRNKRIAVPACTWIRCGGRVVLRARRNCVALFRPTAYSGFFSPSSLSPSSSVAS